MIAGAAQTVVSDFQEEDHNLAEAGLVGKVLGLVEADKVMDLGYGLEVVRRPLLM